MSAFWDVQVNDLVALIFIFTLAPCFLIDPLETALCWQPCCLVWDCPIVGGRGCGVLVLFLLRFFTCVLIHIGLLSPVFVVMSGKNVVVVWLFPPFLFVSRLFFVGKFGTLLYCEQLVHGKVCLYGRWKFILNHSLLKMSAALCLSTKGTKPDCFWHLCHHQFCCCVLEVFLLYDFLPFSTLS